MYVQQTRQWIQSIVIDLNLCPFAKREMDHDAVKITASCAIILANGITDFMQEIEYLNANPGTGTTLLIFPHFLANFFDYLDFIDLANETMADNGYQGIYQLATFHPAYCFHGNQMDDVTNYTNRSPYPMVHILREEMLDRAIAYYGNTEEIPKNNILRMQRLGLAGITKILAKA
jgi:hypothetical protein